MYITGNSAYVVDGVDSVIARYSQENNRVFYKLNGGRCIRICIYPSASAYSGPMLIALSPDAVAYYIYYQGQQYINYGYSSVVIDGITWYVSVTEFWTAGSSNRNLDSNPEINGVPYPLVCDTVTSDPNFYTELETFIREVLASGNIEIICESNGGGATHIAKVTGQLKDLSSHLSDILIVSGGGGGGMLIGDTAYPGADAGGISGSGDNSADQSTGYAFGQGESGTDISGGGGGLYGGYKGVNGTPEPDIPDWAVPYLQNISKFILDGNDYLAVSADYGWMQGKWEGQYTHSYYNSSTDWTINSSRVSSLALLDIHIDGSDNSYSVTGNFINKNDAFSNYGSSGYRAHLTYSNGTTHVSDTDGTIEQSPFTQTFSSLESALSYCQNHFKHCGVYVNNELWINAEVE